MDRESGRQRLQYPEGEVAKTNRALAEETVRRLSRERDGYLDQAQECSDAIRRIKAEYGLSVDRVEPIQVEPLEMADDRSRANPHPPYDTDRGMAGPSDTAEIGHIDQITEGGVHEGFIDDCRECQAHLALEAD